MEHISRLFHPLGESRLFAGWLLISLAGVAGIGLLGDASIGEAFATLGWLGVALCVWLLLFLRELIDAWRAPNRSMMAACFAPIVALCALIALTLPASWAGAKVKVYAILAANYAAYEAEARAAAGKPGNDIAMWTYGGWSSDDLGIVRDARGNPTVRLRASRQASYASCRWLIGAYYDCVVTY